MFYNAQPSDSGVYVCVGVNGFGQREEATATITIIDDRYEDNMITYTYIIAKNDFLLC